MGWIAGVTRRGPFVLVALLVVAPVTGFVFVEPVAAADPSLSIDRVTTTRGDERVTGVVSGQPVEVHISYAGLGAGVHTITIRDARSGERVINTTVVGDAGTTRIGVSGDALRPAYAASPENIALEAASGEVVSGTVSLDKVDRATLYLADVPARVGRNESVQVTYYGWTRESVEFGLYADHPPLADNTGEDTAIERVRITPPAGDPLPHEFSGTVSFRPSDYRERPEDDSIRVQIREFPRPDPTTYWGNGERILITNQPPMANFAYDPPGPRVNQSVQFDATESRDPDGQIVEYAWDFDDDGRTDATGSRVDHAFLESGQRTVSLTVTDDGGASNTLRVRVPVVRVPTAVFDVSPGDPVADRPIRFDATRSSDQDGQIDRYAWDFDGDNRIDGFGRLANHTYDSAGAYRVTLSVTDDDGATNRTSRRVVVDPLVPPTANVVVTPAVPTVNGTTTFDATGSSDPDGRIVRFEWAFGDGTTRTTAEPIVEHTYAVGGNYTLVLTTVDDDEATAMTRSTVRVNRPPSARVSATPPDPRRNETVTFDATASGDADGTIVRYDWTFGDGTSVENAGGVVRHTYDAYGTYAATVTVVDDDGARVTERIRVAVENRPPVAAFSVSPFRPKPDRGVQFDATASRDPDGTVTAYRWDFDGDGEIDTTGGPEAVYRYDERGRYSVRLVVEDDAGATNTTVKRLTVGSTLPLVETAILLALGIWVVVFFWLSGSLPDRIASWRPRRLADRLKTIDVPFGDQTDDEEPDDRNEDGEA